jgi:hypothetical protein
MKSLLTIPVIVALGVTAACARAPEPVQSVKPQHQPVTVPSVHAAPTERGEATLPRVIVHKSASCGCCGLWVEHLRDAGFEVEVRNKNNLHPIKERLGVPLGKGSCHTAEIGGYVVEGHVPASDIKRLLRDRPSARGLVLPGMPLGSPGMEMPDGRTERYTVELVRGDGTTVAYAQHGL